MVKREYPFFRPHESRSQPVLTVVPVSVPSKPPAPSLRRGLETRTAVGSPLACTLCRIGKHVGDRLVVLFPLSFRNYRDCSTQALFTGDMILGCGTAIFDDFASYMDSLQRVRDMSPKYEGGFTRYVMAIRHARFMPWGCLLAWPLFPRLARKILGYSVHDTMMNKPSQLVGVGLDARGVQTRAYVVSTLLVMVVGWMLAIRRIDPGKHCLEGRWDLTRGGRHMIL